MDDSPLVKALDHAKEASKATDSHVALRNHEQAATAFARAATQTRNAYALRTLKLLEDQHRQLCIILKAGTAESTVTSTCWPARHTMSTQVLCESSATTAQPATTESPTTNIPDSSQSLVQKHQGQPPPTLSSLRQVGSSSDVASSIANNLASARGIRAGNARAHLTHHSREQSLSRIDAQEKAKAETAAVAKDQRRLSRTSSLPNGTESPGPKAAAKNTPGPDGYARFSSTFGSLVSALSAPLAFAGLPLNVDEPEPDTESVVSVSEAPYQGRRSSVSSATSIHAGPDLKKIFSAAALRSRDKNLVSESFCLVEPRGKSVSYASILHYADKEKRREEAARRTNQADCSDDPGGTAASSPSLGAGAGTGTGTGVGTGTGLAVVEDDYVMAAESVASLSRATQQRVAAKGKRVVIEELEMENQNLKHMVDHLSRRLHAFESSSQKLKESLRLRRQPASPTTSFVGGSTAGSSDVQSEQMRLLVKENEALRQKIAAMERTLDDYRDKWQKLKAGHRARRAREESEAAITPSRDGRGSK